MSERVEIVNGDSLLVLQLLDDNSVDAIVTDPPYGLSFMGKKWDYDVPSEELWRQCFRVLKAGGHLLCFAGTRTQHRMAVRIEDAGFEIRDMIAWVYGSGFPKSLDVSKAIDKRGGNVAGFSEFRDAVKDAMKRNGVSRQKLQEALGNYMISHYLTAGSQPAIPILKDYRIIRDVVGLGNAFDELFNDEAEREVVGEIRKGAQSQSTGRYGAWGDGIIPTAPATDAAKQWEGWGTALKPALEPITVARKPLIGTVAENVLQHGTGAINVDGCRVGTEEVKTQGGDKFPSLYGTYKTCEESTHIGRWPANFIYDGSEEVLGLFPQSKSTGGTNPSNPNVIYGKRDSLTYFNYGDSGSAARFFYCAKASKADRGENHHPTVKPTDLMRYLCRLVTPPDGLVLDPFMGSGSTGKAAVLEGFRFIGIEREEEYCEIAKARIKHAQQ